jgi:hypothetical protein
MESGAQTNIFGLSPAMVILRFMKAETKSGVLQTVLEK